MTIDCKKHTIDCSIKIFQKYNVTIDWDEYAIDCLVKILNMF